MKSPTPTPGLRIRPLQGKLALQLTKKRDYVLVESERGESIIRQVLPAIEELIVPNEYAEHLGVI